MTITTRLALIFFAITAAAVGIVYLYVIPQLESNLTADRLRALEQSATDDAARLSGAMLQGADQQEVRRLVRRLAQQSDARVTVLGIRGDGPDATPAFVVADSESDATATAPDWRAARVALLTTRTASAVESIGGDRIGEAAVPLYQAARPRWVVVFSRSLAEVRQSVALIQRQILIAGLIALLVAVPAGAFAARSIGHRVRRLRAAAGGVAEGDFSTHIPVDSRDELGELALTFNEMQRRLSRLDSARRDFIANASHELRTPIFSLAGFIELLADEDLDPETRRGFIETMQEQVDRMARLAGELLDLSKLDADALELSVEDVDLARLGAQGVAEFAPSADRRDVAIAVHGALAVARADAARVSQIVRILLDNALRHTPPGTTITVTTTSSEGACELTVTDEGPGIPPRDAHRVFDRFFTGSQTGGSGLGLAIARELAERMGGTVELRSRRRPTVFTLILPEASGSPLRDTTAAAAAS